MSNDYSTDPPPEPKGSFFNADFIGGCMAKGDVYGLS